MNDWKFDAMYTREVNYATDERAVEQIHNLMSTFGITNYKINYEENRLEVSKPINIVIPCRKLNDLEKSMLSWINCQVEVLS